MSYAKTIYLVDDDQDDRFFIREAIQESGADVRITEVENGFDLLTLVKDVIDPESSVIIIDMNMPKMNGLETVAAIRTDNRLAAMPIVMLSTSSNPTLIRTAYLSGVTSFVTKPSSFDEFAQLAREIGERFL
ncbi:Response regulator receiver domain-containing protein [Dyadobacter sp. SG02]|uniref:response regulator n=1 Tax=Dyadobacter sp. SG02 TaxID=1855291 RepID=UPI0008C78206|nr:response regulator [Dyadobacter sp. SG02]SEI39174.1 Response regulator receiver domain-containing protein [Dyadobacter sp. SG02]